MSSYNLIPFTEMSAVAFTTIVTTTTATVDGNVVILDGAKALAFRGLTSGSMATPMYSWANESRGSGMWMSQNTGAANTTGLSFSLNGTTVGYFKAPRFMGFGVTNLPGEISGVGTTVFQMTNTGGNFANIWSGNFRTTNLVSGEGGLALQGSVGSAGIAGFAFLTTAPDLAIKISTVAQGVATAVGGFWDGVGGAYYTRPGLQQFATTTITPSVARSSGHVTNLLSGATTVFVILPSTVPGMEHTITNAQGTAQTVVISPRAAGDRLSVFGLTKANGASVAANAPFSTITFHCITSTRWVATKLMGAWV